MRKATVARPYRLGEAAELLGVGIDTVRRWTDSGRLKTRRTRGNQRIVEPAELARLAESLAARRRPAGAIQQSARNSFPGIVTRVTRDRAAATVEIQSGPNRIVSLMTREAADQLGLKPGDSATAVIKATTVVVERA